MLWHIFGRIYGAVRTDCGGDCPKTRCADHKARWWFRARRWRFVQLMMRKDDMLGHKVTEGMGLGGCSVTG